jgi:hypothetical protein
MSKNFSIRYLIKFITIGFVCLSLVGCATTTPPHKYFVHTKADKGKYSTPNDYICTDQWSNYHKFGEEKKLIVLVHGVTGSVNTTWGDLSATTKNSNVLDTTNGWLSTMCYDKVYSKNGFDFLAISYRTELLKHSSSITEVANRILIQMINRKLFQEYEQIHFITHSMGGLVTKRMLVNLKQQNDLKKLYSIRSVTFLGTPAHGSFYAKLGALFSGNRQFSDMAPEDMNTYIQTLNHDWETMRSGRIKDGSEFPLSYCGYETLPYTSIMPKIVPVSSSETSCDSTAVAFDRTHTGLTDLDAGKYMDVYNWTRSNILRASDKSSRKYQKVIVMDGTDIDIEKTMNCLSLSYSNKKACYSDNGVIYDVEHFKKTGETNGDIILDILDDLELRGEHERIYKLWQNQKKIKERKPSLIIIHYSGFYPQTKASDNDKKFSSFMSSMMNTDDIKFLVYTRAGEHHTSEYDKIKDYFKKAFGDDRLTWWDDLGKGITNEVTFNDPQIRNKLEKKVKDLLKLK